MKEYQLNIDSRILELLGPNLYTNIYYVLAELVANAYDADATNVYIIASPDEIRIEDDGHGMSYAKGEVKNYLKVAAASRTNEESSLTRKFKRRKMGRKGVGKLAALSVSSNVSVMTISEDGEKSGFILSRQPGANNQLQAIAEKDILFKRVVAHGSAIVMHKPQYTVHKTLSVVRKNLLKIFPLVGADFNIHLIQGKESLVIENFDKHIMGELGALITLGDEFSHLVGLMSELFPEAPEKKQALISCRDSYARPACLQRIDGGFGDYDVTVSGWIGAYKSTRGKKSEPSDFPDNFISLYANKKLGEFNVLPLVGQNKLNEVYIVGQLHIDIFEKTELPDMALSNRQGYRSDDPRYVITLDYIRRELLPEILGLRQKYADFVNQSKNKEKEKKQNIDEQKLRESINKFRKQASADAAEKLVRLGSGLTKKEAEQVVLQSINDNSPDLGLKRIVDNQKKRLLISHTLADKPLADIIYDMLCFNGMPAEDILYTNCDNEICRIPIGHGVYDYLKKFFVDSYSSQKIFVAFVTSENTKKSWGALTEIGASWITQVSHEIFNISPFRPERPLDNEAQWHVTNIVNGDLCMTKLAADIFCQKIEYISHTLGYQKNTRDKNMDRLESLIAIK